MRPAPRPPPRVQPELILPSPGDLAQLLSQAKARFSDISWYADDGTQVFAHKAVVYARAAGASRSLHASLATRLPSY